MSFVAPDLVAHAERRARLASVLGRLLLSEPGDDVAEVVSGIAELEALASHDDELSAEYERLFLREVPLYESVFLGTDGQRGGPIVSQVTDLYRRHDFDEAGLWRVPSADHLGLELRFYAHVVSLEAAAWNDDRPEEAARLIEAEREFLGAHLGQWGEVCVAAIQRRASDGPYRALATAVGELLASEAERLRPAPHHPGMPDVVVDRAPARVGPARLTRWLLAPSLCGAFLDVDDLADAALSIGAPWRPSDARSRFRHVVESAIDGGDLDRLLAQLRPAVEQWREAHALNEAARDADRRVWIRWRQQADETLALIDRVGRSPRDDASGGKVVVTVSGPGHHDRAAAAAEVIAALAPLGRRIAVSSDLRPRLADDVESLLASGAEEVLLSGGSVAAVAVTDGGERDDRERRHLTDPEVLVRLVASAGPRRATVQGPDPATADVLRLIPQRLKP